MQKKWLVIVGALIVLALIGALFGKDEPKETANSSKQVEQVKQENTSSMNNEEEARNLQIALEAQDAYQDGKQKVVIWTINNSKYKLKTATVEVRSTDEKDKKLSGDIVWPENIESGKRQYGILWLKTNSPPVLKYKLVKAEFE